MRRYSVTELEAWEHCRHRWENRYERKLYPREGSNKSAAQMSGAAIAEGIEAGVLAGGLQAAALLRVEEYLGEQYNGEKFIKGAQEAIKAVPDWIWNMRFGVPEDKLEPIYYEVGEPGHWEVVPDALDLEQIINPIQLVGMPDLWTANDESLVVVEFKSTSASASKAKGKLDGYNWASQPYAYAFMLKDSYEELAEHSVYVQHVLVTTRGECFEGPRKLVGPVALSQWRDWALTRADSVGKIPNTRNFGTLCDWCEFRDACTMWRVGGNWEAVLDAEFEARK